MSSFRQIHGLAFKKSPDPLFLVLFVAEYDWTLTPSHIQGCFQPSEPSSDSHSGSFPVSSQRERPTSFFSRSDHLPQCRCYTSQDFLYAVKVQFLIRFMDKSCFIQTIYITDTPEHQCGEIFPASQAQMCSLKVCWGFWGVCTTIYAWEIMAGDETAWDPSRRVIFEVGLTCNG